MSDPSRAPDPSATADEAPTAIADTKRALRARARGRRAGWAAGDVDAWSRDLRAVLAGDPRWTAARQVAAFLSLPGEPDLRPALTDALARGVVVWLPRVVSSTALAFVPLQGGAESWQRQLVRSSFGIEEPIPRPEARGSFVIAGRDETGAAQRASERSERARLAIPLDLVLVPGLAFGRDGARLGFGRGYYDRVLAPLRSLPRPRPALLGVGFADTVWEAGTIPLAAHDVPVDAVVTERDIHVFRGENR